MTTRLKWLWMATLLVIIGVSWWLAGDGVGGRTTTNPRGNPGLPDIARSEEGPAGVEDPSRSDQGSLTTAGDTIAEDSDQPLAVNIRGVVLDEHGQPTEGVLLWPRERGAPPSDPVVLAHSDDRGRFELAAPITDATILQAEADGYFHFAGAFTDWSAIVIRLSPSVNVFGTVTDAETGRPVAAHLTAYHSACRGCEPDTARAGPGGDYELPGLFAHQPLFLRVRAEGYPEHSMRHQLTRPGPERLDIELARGIDLTVEVRTLESHAPIEGAEVYDAGRGPLLGTTDDQGRFTCPVLAESTRVPRVDLAIVAAGRVSVRRVLRPPGIGEELHGEFLLPQGGRIEGVVRNLEGDPIQGASIIAALSWPSSRLLAEADATTWADFPEGDRLSDYGHFAAVTTDDNGRFLVDWVPPSTEAHAIFVRHPDYLGARCDDLWVRRPGDHVFREILLERGGSIEGRVHRREQPLASTIRWRGASASGTAHSGENGLFRIDHAEPGTVRLTVEPSNTGWRGAFGPTEVLVKEGEVTGCDIDLGFELATIQGVVLEQDQPLANVRVSALAGQRADRRTSAAVTDGSGRFTLEVPASTETRYQVSTTGAEVTDVAPGARGVILRVVRKGTLRVRARVAGTGDLVQEYQVSWRQPGEAFTFWVEAGNRAPLGDSGVLRHDLDAGRYDILVEAPRSGLGRQLIPGIEVLPGRETDVIEVSLSGTATLEIQWKGSLDDLPPRLRVMHLVNEDDLDDIHVTLNEVVTDRPIFNQSYSYDWTGTMTFARYQARSIRLSESMVSEVRGLTPGRYVIRVWPDDLVFEPAVIEITDDSRKTVEVSFRSR